MMKIGTLLQGKKYKDWVGMIIKKEYSYREDLYTINFAGTNKGLFSPRYWLENEIVEYFEVIG